MEKKRLYKMWVKSKLTNDYIKYRLARRYNKKVERTAKDQSWKQYGEELGKYSLKESYKSVKAMQI